MPEVREPLRHWCQRLEELIDGMGGGGAPTGPAGGDLGGTYPNPTVAAVHETSGPTKLTIGTVADGEFLRRIGGTVVSAPVTISAPYLDVPASPNAYDDEFASGSADLAVRGWMVGSGVFGGTFTTFTRNGPVAPNAQVNLPSNTYNSSIVKGKLLLQCSSQVALFKSFSAISPLSGTNGATFYGRVGFPSFEHNTGGTVTPQVDLITAYAGSGFPLDANNRRGMWVSPHNDNTWECGSQLELAGSSNSNTYTGFLLPVGFDIMALSVWGTNFGNYMLIDSKMGGTMNLGQPGGSPPANASLAGVVWAFQPTIGASGPPQGCGYFVIDFLRMKLHDTQDISQGIF